VRVRACDWNSLDSLDPDAVVCDVQVVEDVGGVVLPEHSVDVQQALQDTSFACTQGQYRTTAPQWTLSIWCHTHTMVNRLLAKRQI
jgi:hypothetical protein